MPPIEESLLEVLRRQKQEEEDKKNLTQNTLPEWVQSLENLMNQIEEWLTLAIKEGLVTIQRNKIILNEKLFGNYEAPSLIIRLPQDRVVRVEPIGRFSTGGMGRVDL